MNEPLVVDAGELSVGEVLSALNEGRRVVVHTEFVGATHEVTLRWDGETYYCDTPTRLHRHGNEAEMRSCIEKYGYGRTSETDETDGAKAADRGTAETAGTVADREEME